MRCYDKKAARVKGTIETAEHRKGQRDLDWIDFCAFDEVGMKPFADVLRTIDYACGGHRTESKEGFDTSFRLTVPICWRGDGSMSLSTHFGS